MELSEQMLDIKHYQCKAHPNIKIECICTSSICGYYRQMCYECVAKDKKHKEKHVPINSSIQYCSNKIKDFEQSLKIIKKLKTQKLQSSTTLPIKIQQQLSQIREIINIKINQFERSLAQKYQKHVNLKLQNLQDTLKLSLQFLARQRKLLDHFKYSEYDLKKFFLNFVYWQQQKRYYQSYIQQILQKRVRSFTEGFDDDNIMRLVVGFEQNIEKIFMPKAEGAQHGPNSFGPPRVNLFMNNPSNDYIRIHEIIEDRNGHLVVEPQLVNRLNHKSRSSLQIFKSEELDQLNREIKQQQSLFDKINFIHSVYYQESDCYYIFGSTSNSSKPSDDILRCQGEKKTVDKKLTSINKMIQKRSHFSICLVNNQIFVIGGYNDQTGGGCMSKCQKLVLFNNKKSKVYLVSSLQQKSACHSTVNYKNKFILKFGGTSYVKSAGSKHQSAYKQLVQLYPQIYSLQKQQWKLIRYQIPGASSQINQNNTKRLNFGLYPFILYPLETDSNKIIIFANQPMQCVAYNNFHGSGVGNLTRLNSQHQLSTRKKITHHLLPQNYRQKFTIKCIFHNRNQLQLKILQSKYQLNRRIFVFPQTVIPVKNKNKIKVLAKDLKDNKAYDNIQLMKIKNVEQ